MAKINSLQDPEICRALYRASQAGVKVLLNVRGICCLRPGVTGVSENIEVRSIVDRFLEHARVFYFRNGGHEEVYLSSADWMQRNLSKRLELLFPVIDPNHRRRLIDALETYFADNVKAWRLLRDGTYERVAPQGPAGPRPADVLQGGGRRRPRRRPRHAAVPPADAAETSRRKWFGNRYAARAVCCETRPKTGPSLARGGQLSRLIHRVLYFPRGERRACSLTSGGVRADETGILAAILVALLCGMVGCRLVGGTGRGSGRREPNPRRPPRSRQSVVGMGRIEPAGGVIDVGRDDGRSPRPTAGQGRATK